jgi:biopolymer transport protein ExbD
LTIENTERIKLAQQTLLKKKQELGDIYGIYNEMAGDFAASLQDSMVTTQKPARNETFKALMQTERLATIQDLEELWLLVQEEMTESEKANVFVAINAGGEIWIDKRPVDIRSVRIVVARLHAENPEGSVVIQSDQEAATRTLVAVMDQIRLAGIEKIAIAANKAMQ